MPLQRKKLFFRVIAPAYPELNIYSRIACKTTALGPVMIATTANQLDDWDVEVIDENNYWKPGPRDKAGLPDHKALQKIHPADVVGFYGGLSSTIPRLYELARFYKAQGVCTIAGGQHFIKENIHEALLNDIDFVVRGEGEDTIQDLLTTISTQASPETVSGLGLLQNNQMVLTPERLALGDLDALPIPDFGLIRYARIKVYPVNWTRGCSMNCEFCTVNGKPHHASAQKTAEQIISLAHIHNARHFFIVDDLFGQYRSETLKFCHLLASYQKKTGVKLDMTVQIRLDLARDTELLQAMRAASINTICIGFESPIPEELMAMNKKIKPQDMQVLALCYHRAGFLVHGMFIFGYPLPPHLHLKISVRDRIRHFKKFIRKSKLDTIQVLLPVPLPGTRLTNRLAAQNRIFNKNIIGWEYYDGNFPLFEPDEPLTPEDLHIALRQIMGRFYCFKHMFAIGLSILSFPTIPLYFFKLQAGWQRWYRLWRNSLQRFGGWILFKHWKLALKKNRFRNKLIHARTKLNNFS